MNQDPDKRVEEALLKRACGYDAEDVVIEETDKGGKQRTTRYHIPGDVRAMIFWLRNRQPERWKDRPENGETESDKGVRIVDDIA